MSASELVPGAIVRIRSVNWKIRSKIEKDGFQLVTCRGISGITKNKEAQFVWELEDDREILDPRNVQLVPDKSTGFIDTKLFLGAAFRSTPTTSRTPQLLGRAAIDDLKFQHDPVIRALLQDRVRLLIADDVGLGKTLEAGLITSELIVRGRADRILVVTTRAMLTQFQREFWTRFSIPLARLDSAAIQRMLSKIPQHLNVFDQFDRSIVSIDSLKKNLEIRDFIEQSYWDLIIIDEAHNAANRARNYRKSALRAQLAKLLSRKTDSLLLLTATPHDGSHESFSSLIEMLDRTRVPNPSKLVRQDIDDLVVRRFRNTPEVQKELQNNLQEREIIDRSFPLCRIEEDIFSELADLQLDMDEKSGKGRAFDLFRITLTKAMFSSPAACIETLDNRIKGITNYMKSKEKDDSEEESDENEEKKRFARGTKEDIEKLKNLISKVELIDKESFSKYQDLLRLIAELKWKGKDTRDRLVIFSERIKTIEWLEENLKLDLEMDDNKIKRIDGGSVEADVRTQEILEEFGQEKSPIRILIASDMASEGLNLHYQCFRLIHFDLPWSLLRFQQRNGRIDRYDQDRQPLIYYFVGESKQEKVKQMWVLNKLVEKDKAVQFGLGDPSIFLGVGNVSDEEKVVAEAIARGIGEDEFEKQMNERAAKADEEKSIDEEFDALFGEYSASEDNFAEPSNPTHLAKDIMDFQLNEPPRLFKDVFSFSAEMLNRLSVLEESLFDGKLNVDYEKRLVQIKIPEEMCTTDSLGYSVEGAVDEKYMPAEAVGRDKVIQLTDDTEVVTRAIAHARTEERAWPTVQYLWEGHPILHWFGERAESLFGNHQVPVVKLNSGLNSGDIATIIHGAIYNARGAPVIDRWAVIVVSKKNDFEIETRIEEVNDFIERTGFAGNIPNSGSNVSDGASELVAKAVDFFQTHLNEIHKTKKSEIEVEINTIMERLSKFEDRFHEQLSFEFPELDQLTETEGSGRISHKMQKREAKRKEIDQMFKDYEEWYNSTRQTVDEPNPYVDVIAVFEG